MSAACAPACIAAKCGPVWRCAHALARFRDAPAACAASPVDAGWDGGHHPWCRRIRRFDRCRAPVVGHQPAPVEYVPQPQPWIKRASISLRARGVRGRPAGPFARLGVQCTRPWNTWCHGWAGGAMVCLPRHLRDTQGAAMCRFDRRGCGVARADMFAANAPKPTCFGWSAGNEWHGTVWRGPSPCCCGVISFLTCPQGLCDGARPWGPVPLASTLAAPCTCEMPTGWSGACVSRRCGAWCPYFPAVGILGGVDTGGPGEVGRVRAVTVCAGPVLAPRGALASRAPHRRKAAAKNGGRSGVGLAGTAPLRAHKQGSGISTHVLRPKRGMSSSRTPRRLAGQSAVPCRYSPRSPHGPRQAVRNIWCIVRTATICPARGKGKSLLANFRKIITFVWRVLRPEAAHAPTLEPGVIGPKFFKGFV